jgi:hypothetical protein
VGREDRLRLINGLRGINRAKVFRSVSSTSPPAPDWETLVLASGTAESFMGQA